ncbi:hypothetical protein QYE76_034176 [Lolium multiflorum]|uniref:Transposase (putative) gypsy type domain-containing protein n=1 Tax=Lolium multiflorum TaxID=4521 RepID=A0AAD8VN16_LOLMU|nr:hypothetical protein QYE76_034176 [Lolium multiflorum]
MGKTKGTAGSSASTGAAKVGLDWCASTISNREVNRLRTLGFISSADSDIRLPGSSSRPKHPKGFTVMFADFLFRGFSLPAHDFLRSLLLFYGIQLWQLTNNSILHLSIFITLKIPGINSNGPIFTEDGRSQKTRRRGATRRPPHKTARWAPGPHRPMVAAPRPASDAPFRLLKGFDLKTPGGSTIFPEDVQNSAIAKLHLGTRNSVLAPCRDGELEEIIAIITTDASPSTIHDSPIHVFHVGAGFTGVAPHYIPPPTTFTCFLAPTGVGADKIRGDFTSVREKKIDHDQGGTNKIGGDYTSVHEKKIDPEQGGADKIRGDATTAARKNPIPKIDPDQGGADKIGGDATTTARRNPIPVRLVLPPPHSLP